MESPESYLPKTSLLEKYFPRTYLDEIYSLDEIIDRLGGTDQEFISYLKIYQLGKAALEGHRLDNPGVHPGKLPSFLLLRRAVAAAAAATEGWKTDHGEWSQKNMFAIPNTFQGNSPNSPKFVGAKATLEFKPTGAKKGVLGMTQYNLLTTKEDSDGLYLDEELSLCHVFPLKPKDQNGKRRRSGYAADQFKDVALPELNKSERVMSEVDFKNMHPLDWDDYGVAVPRLGSEHWLNFTKIYTKNPQLKYAACHHCNMMLKLTGGTGPSSLKKHYENKHKQERLPGNSSFMPTPSIALEGHHGITRDSVVEIRGSSLVEIELPQ